MVNIYLTVLLHRYEHLFRKLILLHRILSDAHRGTIHEFMNFLSPLIYIRLYSHTYIHIYYAFVRVTKFNHDRYELSTSINETVIIT